MDNGPWQGSTTGLDADLTAGRLFSGEGVHGGTVWYAARGMRSEAGLSGTSFRNNTWATSIASGGYKSNSFYLTPTGLDLTGNDYRFRGYSVRCIRE